MKSSTLTHRLAGRTLAAVALACAQVACSDPAGPPSGSDPDDPPDDPSILCSIPVSEIYDGGVGRDGIRSLENPQLVSVDHADAAYLAADDRVVGVELDGRFIAVPHNILWWHEIVNFDLGGTSIAVTYCPLTGSSLVFDRTSIDGSELGVSGLIFRNNLIMFDRDTETLWPQMMRRSTCGPRRGQELALFPAIEMTWAGWRELHPEGEVVSRNTGFVRGYTTFPYGDYETPDNPETVFPHDGHDQRRPPKERVLGLILGGDGGIAYPFENLVREERARAIPTLFRGDDAVVLWDSRVQGGAVFFTEADGQSLTFTVESGLIVDRETGSAWTVEGRAVDGPLAGTKLRQITQAYVAFWFAWANFQPETQIWFR